ncbi:hypothetical protein CEK25_003632 [Fusarium fujikuroi]|nr:hypothetical protein CEK25_003632 [Fusarium fujikuroi]
MALGLLAARASQPSTHRQHQLDFIDNAVPDSPPCIENHEQARVRLRLWTENLTDFLRHPPIRRRSLLYALQYDGTLTGIFQAHPLMMAVQPQTSERFTGIFQVTTTAAEPVLQTESELFGIVTTTAATGLIAWDSVQELCNEAWCVGESLPSHVVQDPAISPGTYGCRGHERSSWDVRDGQSSRGIQGCPATSSPHRGVEAGIAVLVSRVNGQLGCIRGLPCE